MKVLFLGVLTERIESNGLIYSSFKLINRFAYVNQTYGFYYNLIATI